jgi:hypothetical protein
VARSAVSRRLFGFVQDTWRGLERCLDGGVAQAALLLVGFGTGALLYVPVHELLHAAACLAAGGDVTVLEVSPWFGGGLLVRVVPFVRSGGDYAGRLSGFDDRGSDWIYLATVLGPYVLSVWPGCSLLRLGAARRSGWLLGFSLPMALAPFSSLTGDAYEIGSIVATWLPPWSEPTWCAALRGDDLFHVVPRVHELEGGTVAWLGLMLGIVLAIVWAWLTYELGALIARRLIGSSEPN